HPTGFTNSAATDSANTIARVLRSRFGHGCDAINPIRKSRNEQKRKTPRTASPKKNEPWQFTQTAKSGGRHQNQRGLRVRARWTMSNSSVSSRYPMSWGRIASPIVENIQATKPP